MGWWLVEDSTQLLLRKITLIFEVKVRENIPGPVMKPSTSSDLAKCDLVSTRQFYLAILQFVVSLASEEFIRLLILD